MTEDLSHQHEPVGDLFETPTTEEEWASHRLSDDQVEQYREQGFLTNIRVLSEDQVDALTEELAGLADPNHPGRELWYEFNSNESTDPSRTLFHALGAWRIAPGFHDILWNPAFLAPAAQLLEGPVRFWHDQIFHKPARDGGVVAWHQDYSYWTRTIPISHLTCWIALDDSDEENGSICYIPGSHRWNLLPKTGLGGDMNEIQTVLTDEQKAQFKPVRTRVKKGEATFHHGLTVHGSFENDTDRHRRATVINTFRDGVLSDQDSPMMEGVDAVPKGEKMAGRFFPLLYDSGSS